MAPLAAALLALGLALPLLGVTPPLALAYGMLVAAPAAGLLVGHAMRGPFGRSHRPLAMASCTIAASVAASVAGALALVVARDAAGFALLALGSAGLGSMAGIAARPRALRPSGTARGSSRPG